MSVKRYLMLGVLIGCILASTGLRARDVELLVDDNQPLPTSLPVVMPSTRPTLQSLMQSHPPGSDCGLCRMRRASGLNDSPRIDPPLIPPEQSLFPDYVLPSR